jgi:uncharacterized protein YjiS (DUF1127 family)
MRGISRLGEVTTPQRMASAVFAIYRRILCMGAWLADCSERARQRRFLAALPDHGLRDIGLTRADVESEIAKPCWRL